MEDLPSLGRNVCSTVEILYVTFSISWFCLCAPRASPIHALVLTLLQSPVTGDGLASGRIRGQPC
jgi:hypothetical protein